MYISVETHTLQKPKAMKAAAHTHDVATVRKAGPRSKPPYC